MIKVISERALKILAGPLYIKSELNNEMRRFPGDEFVLYANLEVQNQIVKNLSFFGELSDFEKIIFETFGRICTGKPFNRLEAISFRECEAYLRDRNSQPSFENVDPNEEIKFKKVFDWLSRWSLSKRGISYEFSSQKGPFRSLSLAEKSREIHSFLSSQEILTLYTGRTSPRLAFIDDLTVYVIVPYHDESDKGLFENLHMIGVETFQEENLNFIPEA